MAETIGALILAPLFVEATAFGTVTVISTTTATIVGSTVLAAGAIGLGILAQPSLQAPKLPTSADGAQTLKQSIPPRIFGYGRARIAGAYMCFEVPTGLVESLDVVALHHGEIGTISEIYLHDDLVTYDGSGYVNTVNGGGGDGRYIGKVLFEFHAGTIPEVASAVAIAAVPTIWTSAHRGDGIASVTMRLLGPASIGDFTTIYPRGQPKLSIVADLTAIYDPTDGTQSHAAPGGWTRTPNPVAQLIDFLTSADHGMGLDYDTLIAPVLDDLIVQGNACEELIELAEGGTEPRYHSNGWAYMTSDPSDVLSAILSTCDGWMTEGPEGTLALWVGKYRHPTVTFTDKHIVGFTIDHGVPDEEAVNEIRFTYTAPDNAYRESPGIPWRDEDDITERGIARPQSLALTWVQSHSQGRRLSKRAMARYMAPIRGSMSLTLYGLKAMGQRWVRVFSDTTDELNNVVIEITRMRIDLGNARVSIEWTLVDPDEIDEWDADTEEGDPPTFPDRLDF